MSDDAPSPAGGSVGPFRDYYDVLDVDPETADEAAITTAYREVIKAHHPDSSDDPNEAMVDLAKKAKEVLTDPTERERYDRLGHQKYARIENLDHDLIATDRSAGVGQAGPTSTRRASASQSSSSTPPSQTETSSEVDPTGEPSGTETGRREGARQAESDSERERGGGLGVTEKSSEGSVAESGADVEAHSRDEAFDYAQEERPSTTENTYSHVVDVMHQTWLSRVAVVSLVVVAGGLPAALAPGLPILGPIVDSIGLGVYSFGLAAVTTTVVFAVTDVRQRRQLHASGEADTPPSGTDLVAGAGATLLAVVVASVGSTGDGAHPLAFARGLMLGQDPASPWASLVGDGLLLTIVEYGSGVVVLGGFLFGAGAVAAGVAERAWYHRYIAGRAVRPALWEIGTCLPLVAVYWTVLFGATAVGPVPGVPPVIPGQTQLSFVGLGMLGALGVVLVALVQTVVGQR